MGNTCQQSTNFIAQILGVIQASFQIFWNGGQTIKREKGRMIFVYGRSLYKTANII